MPEVTRALALRGAELIFMPAGTDKGKLWASWRNLIWSRAIENLAIVVTTQNLFSHAERGLAMVAAPEEIMFESTAAGLFLVDVSLERAREMRATADSVTSSANSAPSRACSARNGSGRNCARPCIRVRRRRRSNVARNGSVRANFRGHVLLAPISVRNPASDTRNSSLDRAAEKRTDDAAHGAACGADRNAGAYVIGGDWIVIKKAPRSTIRCSRWTRRARSAPERDGIPRPARGTPAASASASSRRPRRRSRRATISSSPICARSPCRAWSTPSICRRSPRPRRCSAGTRVTASARIAARRRNRRRAAGGAIARPARPSIFRAPIRW